MEVKFTDLPDWAQRVVRDDCNRRHDSVPRKAKIILTPQARIPMNWHDHNVRWIWLYSGGQVTARSDSGYESAINDSEGLFFGVEGREFNDGEAILILNSHPHNLLEFFTPSWNAPEELEVPISEDERVILLILRSYIPKARDRYYREYLRRLPTEAEFEELRRKGLVTRARAITMAGRNKIEGEWLR